MIDENEPERSEKCLRNRLWFFHALIIGVFAFWYTKLSEFEAGENLWNDAISKASFTLGCLAVIRYSYMGAVMSARCLDLLRMHTIHGDTSAMEALRKLQTNEVTPRYSPPNDNPKRRGSEKKKSRASASNDENLNNKVSEPRLGFWKRWFS